MAFEIFQKNSSTFKDINKLLRQEEKPTAAPILKLQITGDPNYQLDECDILNVIESYGVIVNIELTGPRTALVEFDNITSARTAQKELHGQPIKDLGIKLFLSLNENAKTPVRSQEENKKIQNVARSLCDIDEIYHPTTSTQSLPNLDSNAPVFQYNSNRLSRKYRAQIENDKDFKMANKIIGARGCNMKKILEICQEQARQLNINFQSDSLKLRLRGRGSGFKEGPEQKEANEDLHLCVSSKHSEIYLLACKLVEELLSGLYKEYAIYCQRIGRPLKAPIQIKLMQCPEEGLLALNSTQGTISPRSSNSDEDVTRSPPTQWRSAIKRN